MEDKKVISIRFHMENEEDKQLYEELEKEAGTSASLAFVVKVKLKEAYFSKDASNKEIHLPDTLIPMIREEMQEYGMRLIGAMVSGMSGAERKVTVPLNIKEDILPEKSEELPEGALDFLE